MDRLLDPLINLQFAFKKIKKIKKFIFIKKSMIFLIFLIFLWVTLEKV